MKKVAVNNEKAPDLSKVFNWGLKISNFSELFFVSGHGALKPDFSIEHPGDPVGQMRFTFAQLTEYLRDNDYSMDDVVQMKLTITKEVSDEQFHDVVEVYEEFMSGIAIKSTGGTMRVVDRLAFPGMLVELELLAAK
jgi:2-iminobutanoate/2-iminopropanoate deaminase